MTAARTGPDTGLDAHTAQAAGFGAEFDAVLRGSAPARLVCGETEIVLAVARWHRPAEGDDAWLLDRCSGPVLDLGCGPGRLVAALTARGVLALGVDDSVAAAAHCPAGVLRRDLFGPLPGEGCWSHVLLADGNIGIGGDPDRLLRRIHSLLRPGGTVLIEADPTPDARWTGTARLHSGHGVSGDIRWAVLGERALTEVATAAGLHRTDQHLGARSFVEFTR